MTHQRAGHHVTFPRLLACGFRDAGADVALLFPQPLRIPLSEAESDLRTLCLRDQLPNSPWWWRQLWPRLAERPILLCALWIAWRVNRDDYDLIYWADLEYDYEALQLLLRLGLWRFRTGFTHHLPIEPGSRQANLVGRLHDLALRRGVSLTMFVMSEGLLQDVRRAVRRDSMGAFVPYGAAYAPLTDDERTSARAVLGIEAEARVLLVFGMQSTAKNLELLAQVLSRCSFRTKLTVLFAGTHDPTWRHPFLDFQPLDPASNVTVMMKPGFASDAETRLFFAAADAVWCYYRDFKGASGVFMQSIGCGRMCLAVDQDEIGAMVANWKCGISAKANQAESLSAALAAFVAMEPSEQAAFEAAARHAGTESSWKKIALRLLDRCAPNRQAAAP